jgi:hypothetical protein
MQSFDSTIQLAAIRRHELLQAAGRGRAARLARLTRRGRNARRTEGASR